VVELFFQGKPPRDFARTARLDVHIERTSWIQPTIDAALPALKRLACQAGADAVIDIQQLTSHHLEIRRLHVIATGIKWRAP